jgi:nucleotide-binding universal stress UspA family protein
MYQSILVPVDLAEPELATRAVKVATGLAGAAGRLRLVNVQSVLPMAFMEYVPADFDSLQTQRADEALAKIVTDTGLPATRVSGAVRIGSVYPEILAEAEACSADLIVIGSHRPAMSTYLLGSNATTVVRHAACSVLVVRGE